MKQKTKIDYNLEHISTQFLSDFNPENTWSPRNDGKAPNYPPTLYNILLYGGFIFFFLKKQMLITAPAYCSIQLPASWDAVKGSFIPERWDLKRKNSVVLCGFRCKTVC